jgi:hypothetical protein
MEEQIVPEAGIDDLDSKLLEQARAGAGLADRGDADYLQRRRFDARR